MTKASVAAKEHAIQTKGLSGTTDTFIAKQKVVQTELEATATSSKLASVGVKALSTAFNMFAGIAIMWGITKIIEGFEYLSESAERAKEKLSEIQTELNENNSTYQSNRSTLVGLKEEYDALTKKAEALGGAQNLANDEYERYQVITSQILGITPKLITGWNEEGEAISNKNNLLQTSIDLLDEEYEKSLRNNTTKSKNEDVASGVIAKLDEFNRDPDTQYRSGTMSDMRESFINELRKLETELGMTEHNIVEKIWAYLDPNADPNDFWSEHIDTYEKLRDLIEKDYDKFANSFVDENNPIYELFSDEVIDDMIRNADAYFYEGQRILNDRDALYQDYKDQLNWNAQATRDKSGNNAYKQLTDNGKAFINEYIEGLDYASIKTEEDFVEMANNVQKFTKLLASNEDVSELVESIFTPAMENETFAQYIKRVQDAIVDVQEYCKDNYITVPISIDDNSLIKEYSRAIDFAKEKFNLSYNDKQLETFFDTDSINTIEEIDKFIEIANAADTVAEAIRRYRTSKITDDESTSLFSDPEDIKHLETYQKGIKSISTALSDLNNLNASDITSLMSDFSEYGEVFKRFDVDGRQGVGNLRGALEEIARQMKNTATKEVSQFTESIEEMFEVIENPKGSIDKISSEIEELETVLSNVRNGENVKNIESLINKYDDLADSVVVTADGYSIEEDALISLINARITNLNTVISYESELTKRTLDSIRSRIEAYGLEEKHISAITDIWKKTGSENAILDYTNRILGSGVSIDPELLSQYADYSLELEGLLDKIRELHDKGDSENSKNNTIDWMTTSISNLQEKVDDANRKLENTNGFEAQKEAIKSLNSELENLKKAYVFASDEYNTRYKNALYGLNRYDVDKDDIQRKIEAGFIFDTDSFPSEVAELINDAIDAWNGKLDADNKAIELGVEINENSIKSLELDIEEATLLRSLAESKLDVSRSDKDTLSIYDEIERRINAQYKAEYALAEFEKDSLKIKELKLQKEKDLYDLEEKRLDLVREQNAFEIEQIEQQRKSILDEIDLKGGKGSAQNYNDLIGLNKQEFQKRKSEYEFEIAKLADIKATLGENSDEYREQWSRVNDIADAISECKRNTKEWGLALLQLPLDEIESAIEGLNNQLNSVQSQMDDMDIIIASAQAYIQDEIDEQQKLKDVIQEQIDSLQKSNDERQRAIALQKAQYELERAYSQRSVKVYREGEGFVYEQSREAIRDAQENLDNQKFEDSVHQLEEQLEYYDDIISDLEEIKNQWASVKSEAEDYLNIQKALNAIGIEGIFDVSVIESYTKQYKSLLSTVENLTDTIDSFEAFKKQIQDIVDKFEYGLYDFEETVGQITQVTSDFYKSSGLEGEELAQKVDEVVQEIIKKFDLSDKSFDNSTKNVEDNVDKQKNAFEEITQKIIDETATQEKVIKLFSDEVEKDVEETCGNLVEDFSTAFSQLASNIESITNTINSNIDTMVSKASTSIEKLRSLLSEANSIQSQIDSINQPQIIGGGGFGSAFGANKTTSTFQKYHTGLENGLVGEKGSSSIKDVALTKLSPNEIPAILKVNEAVLTELQQKNVMHNISSSFVAGVKLPKLEKNNTTPIIQNVTLTLPNVTNDGGYNRVVQELKSLQLEALQYSNRK